MEVHAHSHTVPIAIGRKKWTHYLWEFLMLFLAVFCGFLAENIREHQIEHIRENKFMQALLADISEDTTEIMKSISTAVKTKQYEDSVIFYLYNNPPVDFLPLHYLVIDFNALQRLKVVFNEVTALQLKNAGNLRLIRKQDIIRKISLYWKEQENTQISLDRYLTYRNRGREFAEKLFAFSESDLVEEELIKPLKAVKVIQANPVLWAEYANIISHCRITIKNCIDQFQKQLNMAMELSLLLQKEYHLSEGTPLEK
ncbi:MAG TPA: hypothetical protein VKB95_10905 [Chitinophagaceae bacterium]|nr:hypothetical protein [Chitinophagaceae bacterium]